MKRKEHIQGNAQTSINIKTLIATLLLLVAVGANGQEKKLGQPITGLYSNENLTSIVAAASAKVVVLNDLEDHNWSYYQAASNLPTGYPTTYLSSPDPRNVKITYRGGSVTGASDVGISALTGENQNCMIYFKTMEKTVLGMNGNYPYTVISNPFSKRPRTNGATGTNGFYGFAGWKVVSGGKYIQEYSNDAVLPLDATIHFTGFDTDYEPNCISAEVVFEATWTAATVKTGNTAQTFTGGTYETNFWVLSGAANIGNITVPTNCTVSARYPNGTSNFTRNLTGTITAGGNNAKVEFVNLNSTGNVSATGFTFTMGRGITGSGGQLSGSSSSKNTVHTVKIESGTYSELRHFKATIAARYTIDQLMILGCDYDRAKNDNSKLTITGTMYVAYTTSINRTTGSLFVRSIVKSGTYQENISNTYSGTHAQSYYFGCYGSDNRSAGHRYLVVEGGHLRGIAGGTDNTTSQNDSDPAFTLRVRGENNNPIIDGAVYGAAENALCKGRRTLVFTGGTIKGWIAAGANGTQETNGALTGTSYLYFGGKAIADSNGSTDVVNRGVGGNVFGAGCGYGSTSSSGQVTLGTNVVMADEAYVERGVYGGGSYGYTTNTSNIFVLGGIVDGKNGGVDGTSYSANITGGVFGGACQNRGGTVNIYMNGGEVHGGIYGGSNATGTLSGNVTMNINGGQVGTTAADANIHGGGYGQATSVAGNVSLTLGTDGQTTQGVTVYGDVYGGSALGIVNTNASNSTNVTMNAGKVYGSVYGGGLGDATHQANVNGTVTVVVNGGSVKEVAGKTGSGAVYGCNNVSGRPMQNDVTVTVNGTDAAADGEYAIDNVFGGGNAAAYIGNPVVTIAGTKTNCVVGNVYGGGLGSTATVTGNSTVKMNNGRAKNLFGGGSQADLTGSVTMSVTGGRVDNDVYGGGALADTNTSDGTTSVSLTGGTVGNAYGGGLGAKTGINGATADVEAIVNGNVTVDVNGTAFLSEIDSEGIVTKGRVFGCNNLNGTPKGTVTVHVYKTVGLNGADKPERNTNKYEIQAVYGGGNLAAYQPTASNTATKVIIDGCGLSSIAYVYGGGNAAPVPATNVTVNGSYEIDYVFGGGNGKDKILINGVYEDNPGADVGKVNGVSYGTTDPIGTTTTTIYGGVIHHVFGGSNTKGDVTKEAHVILGDQNLQTCEFKVGEVYGAGNEAYMSGSANIKLNCIEGLTEIYGGSRRADIDKDVNLTINGGRYEKVFGGNNESGCIRGSITVTIQENGCLPIYIDELYLGGNEAAYSVYGYNDDKSPKTEGTALYDDPVLNVISATEIGAVYGGGLGNTAIMYGNPHVNINMEPGKVNGKYKYVATNTEHPEAVSPAGYDIYDELQNTSATFPLKLSLGNIGTVFGGGNAAKVVGDTHIQIGTGLAADGTTALKQTDDPTQTRHDAQISRNVYGGGNQAEVTGKTNVVIGHE